MVSPIISSIGKKCLGIDIGTSSIKIVEIIGFGKKKYLKNYAQYFLSEDEKEFQIFDPQNLIPNIEKTSEILQTMFWKGNFKERKVLFSIPDFSTLFLIIDLLPMPEKEIPAAVEFEARHQIPLPLSDIVFDWMTIRKEKIGNMTKSKILLVVVPKNILETYQKIATLCNLNIIGIEAEIFALLKSSVRNKNETVCLLDIGSKSTMLSLVEEKKLISSYSLEFGGNLLTSQLSDILQISLKEAEKLKMEKGLFFEKKEVVDILKIIISKFLKEVKKIILDFNNKNQKKCEKIIISGGLVLMPGFLEYLRENSEFSIEITNPFKEIVYPHILKERLTNLSAFFGIATGLALSGIENIE
ncbi:MAG: pilus assembly protein PilM [Minisyncoccia bacterium]